MEKLLIEEKIRFKTGEKWKTVNTLNSLLKENFETLRFSFLFYITFLTTITN